MHNWRLQEQTSPSSRGNTATTNSPLLTISLQSQFGDGQPSNGTGPVAAKGTYPSEDDLQTFFSNITTMSTKAQEYLLGAHMKQYQVWGVVEHHMNKADYIAARKNIGKAGYFCTANLAKTTDAGGTTGGELIATRKDRTLAKGIMKPSIDNFHCTWLRCQGHTLLIGILYQRTGEDLSSEWNNKILDTLGKFLRSIQAPFVIYGDWQKHYRELLQSGWPQF